MSDAVERLLAATPRGNESLIVKDGDTVIGEVARHELRAILAHIEAKDAALAPFAAACGEADKAAAMAERLGGGPLTDGASPGWGITYGHLKQARAVMAGADAGERYVVWSNEHRAWWGPNRCGYTLSIAKAGRYSREEALSIARGRDGWRLGHSNPDEIAMREEDALAMSEGR